MSIYNHIFPTPAEFNKGRVADRAHFSKKRSKHER